VLADRGGISIKRPGSPANDSFRLPGEDAARLHRTPGGTDATRKK